MQLKDDQKNIADLQIKTCTPLQGTTLATAAKVAIDVPPALELTARKWWRSAVHGVPVSLSHSRVVSRLRSLGLKPEVRASCCWHRQDASCHAVNPFTIRLGVVVSDEMLCGVATICNLRG